MVFLWIAVVGVGCCKMELQRGSWEHGLFVFGREELLYEWPLGSDGVKLALTR